MGALGNFSKKIRRFQEGGGANAEVPAEVPEQEPVEAAPVQKTPDQLVSEYAQKSKALKARTEKALEARMNSLLAASQQRMFDPKMLALAAGLLAPTKTGSFGESLGYGMRGYSEEAEKDTARQDAIRKMQWEMELERQKLQEQQLASELIGNIAGGGAQLSSAPAMGIPAMRAPAAPAMGAPAAGGVAAPAGMPAAPAGMPAAPSAAPVAAPQGAAPSPEGLADLSDNAIQAMMISGNPMLKDAAETALKLREERRKDKSEYILGGQKVFLSRAEIAEMQRLSAAGDDAGLRKFYAARQAPYLMKLVDGQLVAMTPAEIEAAKAEAVKPVEARFGEQREYSVVYQGKPTKVMLTPEQYDRYNQARQQGQGDKVIDSIYAAQIPESKSQQEVRVAGETETAKEKAKTDVENRTAFVRAGQSAPDMANIGRTVYTLASDPKTSGAFGIFDKPGVISAIGTLVRDGIKVGEYQVGIPAIEDALRTAGATPAEIAAARIAAMNLANAELVFAKTYLKGQGAVSDMERRIVQRMAGSLSDSPRVAMYKGEVLQSRAKFDEEAARIYARWEDSNPNKPFERFLMSDDYKNLRSSYDQHLEKLEQKYSGTSQAKPAEAPKAGSSAPSLKKSEGTSKSKAGTLLEKIRGQ